MARAILRAGKGVLDPSGQPGQTHGRGGDAAARDLRGSRREGAGDRDKIGRVLGARLEEGGRYDFVAVLNFPDLEAEFRSRNEVYKLGVLRADHLPAMLIDEALWLTTG